MPPRLATPTILDVAAAAGVSVTTVSRVLNDKDDVAPATAARVRAVISDLGYTSSLAARSLRSHHTNVLGLIAPDMEHAYVIELIRGVSRAISGTKYDLIAVSTGSQSHEERGVWEQQQVMRLNGAIVDGMIVVAPDAPDFRTGFPLVVVDSYRGTATYPTVVSDNRHGARVAMQHLLELGHRRIGFLAGNNYLDSAEQRRLGYGEMLEQAGIAVDPVLLAEGRFHRAAGAAAARQLLGLAEPPTAIFAANDDSAFGVLDTARALGLRVPDDLSVVGFDNVPATQTSNPPLTTVDQHIMPIGAQAVQMLLALIDAKELAQTQVVVPTTLVVRASTAPPAHPVAFTWRAKQPSP